VTGPARVATALRFTPDLHDRLRTAAGDRGLSINWLVNRAVAEFLDRLLPPDEIVWTRPDTGPDLDETAGAVATWPVRPARCDECGETFDGPACPNCGERADATPGTAVAVVTGRRCGPGELHIVELTGAGRVTRATRRLSREQLRWLQRDCATPESPAVTR